MIESGLQVRTVQAAWFADAGEWILDSEWQTNLFFIRIEATTGIYIDDSMFTEESVMSSGRGTSQLNTLTKMRVVPIHDHRGYRMDCLFLLFA
jgi:hypothetical protein